MKRYSRDYFALPQEMRQRKFRYFNPATARKRNGYETKAGILAVRNF